MLFCEVGDKVPLDGPRAIDFRNGALVLALREGNTVFEFGMATRIVYGEDLLAGAGVDWKAYAKVVGERPSAQKVSADRKADQERMAAKN